MTEKKISSGNPGALPRRGPLRTGRARFPGSSAQASPDGSRAGQKCRAGAVADAAAAVGVYEMVRGAFVRRAEVHHAGDRVLADRLARGGVPLLPFLRAWRLVVGVQQQSPAERAPAALAAQQVPGGRIDREPGAVVPLVPVPGEGGVVRGRPPCDHPAPETIWSRRTGGGTSWCPGCRTPTCPPGRVEHAEIPGDQPSVSACSGGRTWPISRPASTACVLTSVFTPDRDQRGLSGVSA